MVGFSRPSLLAVGSLLASCSRTPAGAGAGADGNANATAGRPRAESPWRPRVARAEPRADADAEHGWRRVHADGATPVFRRLAAVDREHVMAVADGRLLRLATDHWDLVRIDGADVRDVRATRAGFFALARGTGVNTGRVMILRTTDGTDLQLVYAPNISNDVQPSALWVVRDREFYVAGRNPALMRVVVPDFLPLLPDRPLVERITVLRDDTIIAWHDASSLTVLHWGETARPAVGDVREVITDPTGAPVLVHEDGRLERARPGASGPLIAPAMPSRPRVVAISAEGVPQASLDDGRIAVLDNGSWQASSVDPGRVGVALAALAAPLVLTADGALATWTPGGAVETLVPSPRRRWRRAFGVRDGTLLLVHDRGAVRVSDRDVTDLDARDAVSRADAWASILANTEAVVPSAADGDQGVVAAFGGRCVRMRANDVTLLADSGSNVRAVTVDREGTIATLIDAGRVNVWRSDHWEVVGEVANAARAGIFLGADGRLRVAEAGRALRCLDRGALRDCGARAPAGSSVASLADAVVIAADGAATVYDGERTHPVRGGVTETTRWTGARNSATAWDGREIRAVAIESTQNLALPPGAPRVVAAGPDGSRFVIDGAGQVWWLHPGAT